MGEERISVRRWLATAFHLALSEWQPLTATNEKTLSKAEGLVPRTGFEPARPLRAPPPQSGLSTSFNTWAFKPTIPVKEKTLS